MNCVIIDDEELPKKILAKLISQTTALDLIEVFDNPIEGLKFINNDENTIDLIFLDILMPNFSGFDLLRAIRSNAQIILISSAKDYALNAFEYSNITDYLLKPFQKDRFNKAIDKAVLQNNNLNILNSRSTTVGLSESEKEIFINTDKRLIKIKVSEIEYIEASGNFINIKTFNQMHLTYSSLKKIEAKLPASSFIRVHRSFIINYKEIIDIQDNSVLINNKLIPISRRYKTQLIKRINLL
ncbi:DNA-binding response regulator, LytR/AlgR family [Gillisia sp. Hel1_33_143]|uniref:LytR/AlgR family response regulator transcription factor n=1 Tax=Gillisia sp. Hel1_33_143 TaxID=1336796 RepID=UPI00087D03A4|nr:LytTR family DNA-binding domain-containing protein [Gillisia sp. Hel1_33_143]SDS18863.1 DNA-binding response regulator, LytR/AlgR family [Gillisia sp. Hel1_33_143]